MAVATTPYQQNDYQAANTYRPYRLPINDIFKANVAQNQFWDLGAEKVKRAYENVLDLKLSLSPNKEIRDNFMKEAEKQITKLNSMNLADPSVQRQGIGIFSPLMKDEGIVTDDAATRHIDKVNRDALARRNSNNGKEYSFDNHQYALQGSDEFMNSSDRMAGKKYLEKRKEYEPYYDYTEDFERALKDCQASSNTIQSPSYGGDKKDQMSGYMLNESVKTRTAEKARVCIEAGISPKAYRQLQIEGSVRYRNNKGALAQDVSDYLGNINAGTASQLQEIAAQTTAIRENKDLSDADKATALKALSDRSKILSKDIDGNSVVINKLVAGDLTPLDENLDSYAGAVYTYRKLHKRAVAASFEERERKLIADPVQINERRFVMDQYLKGLDYQYDKSLKEMDQEHDTKIKMLDLMYGGADASKKTGSGDIMVNPQTGQITINPNIEWQTPNLEQGAKPDEKAYSELTGKVDALNKASGDNNLELYNTIMDKADNDEAFRKELMAGFNVSDWDQFKNNTKSNRFTISATKSIGGIQETSWFKAYFPLKKDDPTFNKWAETNTSVSIGINSLKRRLELGEKQVFDEIKPKDSKATSVQDLEKEAVASIKKTAAVGNKVITPLSVQTALSGATVDGFKITREAVSTPGYGASVNTDDLFEFSFYLDGKKILGKEREQVQSVLQSVLSTGRDMRKTIDKKRAEVYGNLGFARDRWALTPDSKSKTVETIKGRFPDVKDISIAASDFSGGIKINHPGVTPKDLDAYRDLGLGTTATIENGYVILRNTKYNVVPKAIDSPMLKEVAFQLSTIAVTRDFLQSEPGQRISSADIEIPIYVDGKREKAIIQTYNSGGSPVYKVQIGEKKIEATNSYDLMEQLAMLPKIMRDFKFTPPATK